MVTWFRLLAIIIFSTYTPISGFAQSLKSGSNMNIDVYLGQSLKKSLESSDVNFSENCIPDVHCQYDYSIPASTENQPSLILHVDGFKTTFKKVNGVFFQASSKSKDTTELESFYFHLTGLPDKSLDTSNKKFAYDLLSKLLDLGWKRYIYESEPRVSGEKNLKLDELYRISGKHMMSSPLMDPSYVMSDEQWNKLGSRVTWRLHHNNAFLQLHMMRQKSDDDGYGSYLFSISVESDESWYRSFFENNKKDWKILLPMMLKSMKEKRITTERKLKEKGIAIERNYKDPTIDF